MYTNIPIYFKIIILIRWRLTQVLKLQKKKNSSDIVKIRRDLSMTACELDEAVVTQECFIAEGGQGKVFKGVKNIKIDSNELTPNRTMPQSAAMRM